MKKHLLILTALLFAGTVCHADDKDQVKNSQVKSKAMQRP